MRIARSLLGLIEPLVQAYFPTASRSIKKNRARGIASGLRFLLGCTLVIGVIGCSLFLAAGPLTRALAGASISEVTHIMRLFAFLPVIAIVSNILGLGMLVNLGHASDYSKVMIGAGLVCTGALFASVPSLGALGAALSVMLCESFATLAMTTVPL